MLESNTSWTIGKALPCSLGLAAALAGEMSLLPEVAFRTPLNPERYHPAEIHYYEWSAVEDRSNLEPLQAPDGEA